MPSVKRGARAQSIRRRQRCADFPRSSRHDPSVGVDRCRHPRIRRRQQPPLILDRAHLRLLQMLLPRAAVAVPPVIGNIQQNLCALQRPLPYFVGKNRFVADKHSHSLASSLQRHTRCAVLKLSHLFGQPSSERKQLRKRQILPEWHQMHFVISSYPLPLRVDQRRGIENLRILCPAMHGGRDADRARDHPRSRLSSQRAHRLSKHGVVGVERRRRLGPDNQIIMLLFFSGGMQTYSRQLPQRVLKIFLSPHPAFLNRDIRLDQIARATPPPPTRREQLPRLQDHRRHTARHQQPLPPILCSCCVRDEKRGRKHTIH